MALANEKFYQNKVKIHERNGSNSSLCGRVLVNDFNSTPAYERVTCAICQRLRVERDAKEDRAQRIHEFVMGRSAGLRRTETQTEEAIARNR